MGHKRLFESAGLTRKQRALIERHANAYDIHAKALKILGPSARPKPSVRSLHNDIVTCSYDRSLTRSIAGVCSTPTICNNISYLSRGAVLKVPVPLLWEHNPQGGPIGQVTYLHKTPKQITISAVIFSNAAGDHAWQTFQTDELMTGLSIGCDDLHMLAKVDGVRFYNRFVIKEVSVTRNPVNPDCHFRFYDEADER